MIRAMCNNASVALSPNAPDPFDLLVVGDGIIGLATALACHDRQPDLRIALVGPESRSGGASQAAAAMLTALAEVDDRTLQDERRRAKFELARRSVPRWPGWIARRADAVGLTPPSITPGTVVTVTDPLIDGPTLEAIRTAADLHGVSTETLEIRDVPGLRPRRTPPEAPALRIAGEGAVDPIEVLEVLDRAAGAAQVVRMVDRAVRLEEGNVELASGMVLRSDRVLIANGAHAGGLLHTHPDLAGTIPAILFGTGVGIRATLPAHADVPSEVVRTPNRPDGDGVYFAPHGTGRFYVGATCDVAAEPRDHPRIAALRRILDAAMNDLSAELGRAECRPVLGHRPVSADGAPLLGRATDTVWIATGTHRDGFVSAPEISDLLARELLSGERRLPRSLRPCRAESMARS